MKQQFETEQWLPYPLPLVFAFFANPGNLPPLMPGWQRARIAEATLVPPPPRPAGAPAYPGVAAGDGTRLLIKARALPGLPFQVPWLAQIEDFHWNDHFCDVQLQGPFAYWRHCHSVRAENRGGQAGTVVRDAVTYELPLPAVSWIGAPLSPLAMRAMFGYRQKTAPKLFAAYAATAEPQVGSSRVI